MYRISKYSPLPKDVSKNKWVHDYNRQKLGLGPVSRRLLPELLGQQTSSVGKDWDELGRQLVVKELVSRGYFIPENGIQSAVSEESHLSHVQPTQLSRAGFFDLPTSYPHSLPEDTKLAFLGIPSDLGAYHPGTRNGPSALRDQSRSFSYRSGTSGGVYSLQTKKFVFNDVCAFDLGDVNLQRLGIDEWLRVTEGVVASMPPAVIPFTIGGDHTFSLATICGVRRKTGWNFMIVHIDSNLDLKVWGDFNE